MPLAIVTRSGVTPQFSKPQKCSPVRPKPVCTSSATHSPPAFRTISYTILKYSGGGVTAPPTPWIGSAIKHATCPHVSYLITFSTSYAHFSPQLGYSNPYGQR